ncbi:ATP-dependent DNA helicase [Noviherbaspirillum galbum]|uniref:AAA family ATPase n=1 Tax=Noviherbaspirillum galbum TaxID=2709383 RepID=A0A6B3SPJ8_9BURK|nr:AAA family ATPase [Noviherbaspirillum galbum]NEX60636.1 AAA family ATPase [Noviherbaspirillum galbum]
MSASSQEIVGVLTSCEVYNERWGRGILRLEDGDFLVVTGESLVGLTQGNRYRMDGSVVHHPRFGRQFECKVAAIDIPVDSDALVRYLRNNFKGCGAVTARKVVEQYHGNLAALRDQLVSNPYGLDFSRVTRRRISLAASEDLKGLIYRDLATRVGMTGVSDAALRKVADWLAQQLDGQAGPVERAWAIFSSDPYAPVRHVDGYGFMAADQIAVRGIGFPRLHPCRLAALATHALREGCERGGHAFLLEQDLAARIAWFDPEVDAQEAIVTAMERGEPIIAEAGCFYPRALWMSERALARHLAQRALRMAAPIFQGGEEALDASIRQAEAALSEGGTFALDASQRKAVAGMLTSRHLLHTLTASPGCGKTALMEVLLHVAGDRKFLFCAPTGKAAKVLAARVRNHGRTATTIHAMLGAAPEGHLYGVDNPLDAEVVVVDEASMNDLALTRALLDALAPDTHVIFLGDADQLPSVGPGDVLHDLLQLPFDHHRLDKPYRNDGGILDVVRQVRKGKLDGIGRADVRFARRLPPCTAQGIEEVMEDYFAAIARHGMPRVALLTPRRKGDPRVPGWNTTYLNELLRQRLNPDGHRVTGTTLRIGDRIIIRKNIAIDRGEDAAGQRLVDQVVNGDTGFITGVDMDSSGRSVVQLMLSLDDGRHIAFPGKDIDALSLAYAMTVHAAQGSEYEEVIFVCTNGSPQFVHRGMAYTAFSRARRQLRVWGDVPLLKAVVERPAPLRNSALPERTRATTRHLQKLGGVNDEPAGDSV